MEVFRQLDQHDLSELQLFLDSKFNNRGSGRHDVIRLCQILSSLYPDYPSEQLGKSLVFEQLFPGKPEVKGKLEKVASELNKRIKEYLLWKQYNNEDYAFERSLNWAKLLREFSLHERFELQLAKIENDFLNRTALSPELYYQRFLLEYERHFWLSALNTVKEDTNLTVTIDSLSTFFEIYRIELLNRLMNQQKVTQFSVPPTVQQHLDANYDFVSKDSSIILLISSKINQLLKLDPPTLEDFSDLMALIKTNEAQILPACLSEYYMYLRNFCTFLINSDHDYLIPVLHQMHKDSLERGYLFIEGKLLASSCLSITKMAIMASRTDWAEEFIESFKDRIIGETEQSDYYRINKSLCLFARKQFEAAQDMLPPVTDNAMYHVQARRLDLMCSFEMNAENLINKIDAFKMMIRRASENFLSPSLRDANNAFANILYQIVISSPGDKKRADKIAARIKSKKPISESKWLLEKVKTTS